MSKGDAPRSDVLSGALSGYSSRPGDLILIAVLVALSVVLWAFSKPVANPITFRIASTEMPQSPQYISFPATTAARIFIAGRLGTSTLECDPGGRVRFVFSPCPNQICVNAGWTSSPFAVACLPNGIMVDFPETHSAFDGVAR